uniref:RNase H type-1 domain-containing protein n=1 Tax=Chenopodium quinoa TaxID=63459 RepID=A0A803L195_CHEQI
MSMDPQHSVSYGDLLLCCREEGHAMDKIPAIPLSLRLPDDELSWDLEKNGEFSVRSANWTIFGGCDGEDGVSASNTSSLWNKIKLEENGFFSVFADWAQACLARLKGADYGLFFTVSWVIWTARNRRLFEGEVCNPTQSMEYAMERVKELQKDEEEVRGGGVSACQKWQPPSVGLHNLNVDGGAVEGCRESAGAVVHDSGGEVQLAAAWRFKDRGEPMIAEAKAVLMGLQMAVDGGFTRLVVETDCQGLMTVIKSQEKGCSSLHLILDDIYHVCSLLDFVSWSFVRRDYNKVAHGLAHCLPWGTTKKVWTSDFPDCIVSFVARDFPMNES